eukprot:9223385-Pyramimonas_sp.AAC.1
MTSYTNNVLCIVSIILLLLLPLVLVNPRRPLGPRADHPPCVGWRAVTTLIARSAGWRFLRPSPPTE